MRSSRHLWSLAAALSFAVIATAVPAQAQFWGNWGHSSMTPPEMMPQTVAQGLNRAGYKVRQIRRNGGVFVVDVADQGGRSLRLLIHPASGEILRRYAMANPRDGASDASGPSRQPALAPAEGAHTTQKARPQSSRAKPAPSQATITPAPLLAPAPAQEQATPEVPAPITAAGPAAAPAAPAAAQPGYANGVPINPLD